MVCGGIGKRRKPVHLLETLGVERVFWIVARVCRANIRLPRTSDVVGALLRCRASDDVSFGIKSSPSLMEFELTSASLQN